MSKKSQSTEHEVKWTDDSIRWSDAENQRYDGPTEFDPFREDPHETFSFHFEHREEDIDLELQGFKHESDEIYRSTGLTLWRASNYMTEFLLRHEELFDGKRILELGSGLGLCGILLSRICKKKETTIVLTDGDTDVLAQLRRNIKQNADSQKIQCHQLLWGKETSSNFLHKVCDGHTFDVIVAADIVYVSEIVKPLWETISTLLGDNGVFVLAYAQRNVEVSMDDVLPAAKDSGFSYEGPENQEGVYRFRRKS